MAPSLTPEQKAVLACNPGARDLVKIQAYAGTGKTFILTQLAAQLYRKNPNRRMIYLCYNKAAREDAEKKFKDIKTVTCMTTHQLALRGLGANFKTKPLTAKSKDKDKPDKIAHKGITKAAFKNYIQEWAMSPSQCDKEFIKAWKKFSKGSVSWNLSNDIKDSLGKFFGSEAYKPKREHIVQRRTKDELGISRDLIYAAMHYLWKAMNDPASPVRIEADGYLKIYANLGVDLGATYPVIFYDEAQDANGPVLTILRNAQATRIVVGDKHQQIYSWRGSVNALDRFEAEHELFLTQSFRFGAIVAQWATAILTAWKDEPRPVRATGKDLCHVPEYFENMPQVTYLCRTNATMFDKAIDCMKVQKSFAFYDGIKALQPQFDEIRAVYSLFKGTFQDDAFQKFQAPAYNIYKGYPTFDSLQNYARSAEDLEKVKYCNFVNKYRERVPEYLSRFVSESVDRNVARAVLITGHKSKGLEWDTVVIMPDFIEGMKRQKGSKVKPEDLPFSFDALCRDEEANLLYVAATRAKVNLGMSNKLRFMINDAYYYRKFLDASLDPGYIDGIFIEGKQEEKYKELYDTENKEG